MSDVSMGPSWWLASDGKWYPPERHPAHTWLSLPLPLPPPPRIDPLRPLPPPPRTAVPVGGEPTPLVREPGAGSYSQPSDSVTPVGRRINTTTKVVSAVAALVVVASVSGVIASRNNERVQLSTKDAIPSIPRPTDSTPSAGVTSSTDTTPTTDATSSTETTPTTTELTPSTTEVPTTTEPPTTVPPTTAPVVIEPPLPGRSRKTVAIVGDSISFISGGALAHEFKRRHFPVEMKATPGVAMATMLPTIETLATTDPWAFIIELGTNDAYGNNAAGWSDAFMNEEEALASQRCVVFITVSPRLGPIASGIDQSIVDAVMTHPNFHLVDWGDIEFTDPSFVGPDQIHPTAAGQAELAYLEKQTVKQDCG